MSKVFSVSLTVAMVVGLLAGLLVAIDKAAALPDVHFSYSTNECVKVVNYDDDDNYSCENLPKKFYHVWEE
jgi:hypothetical protein